MAIVVGVRLGNSNKVYSFDPKGIDFSDGDGVIVETVRGIEYGTIAAKNREIPDKEVVQPLKPVIRKATEEDAKAHKRNLEDRDYLIMTSMKKVAERGLQMKISDAEYTFDRSKVIVYFTADGRVDFRELVRDLASQFKVRIELRQIYERDDIKIKGALATCGRPCCCTTFLQNYDKVTIKMAKLQGLSLNPSKINGCCGKLMCCLRYENDLYQELFKKMPKVGSQIKTPDGGGTVVQNDLLREVVKVKIFDKEGGYEIKQYPLKEVSSGAKQSLDDITDDDETASSDE